MKKALFVLTLLLSVMLILSCASKPKPITSQAEADKAFRDIYQRFRGDLILDGAESHKVVEGDTLSKISREHYNNGFYFPLIMLASSDVVADPDLIQPGMELTVPNLQKNLDSPKAKGKMKNFFEEIAKVYDRREKYAETAEGLRKLAAEKF
jgi:hypothetical protein